MPLWTDAEHLASTGIRSPDRPVSSSSSSDDKIWNMNCVTIRVVSGATGIDTKSIKKILEAIQGKHSIDTLQTIAVPETSHVIWKVLQSET